MFPLEHEDVYISLTMEDGSFQLIAGSPSFQLHQVLNEKGKLLVKYIKLDR